MSILRKYKEKRRARVNISITQDHEKRLKMLAISCNMQPTTLAEKMIRACLDSPQFVLDLQKKYNKEPIYWVLFERLADGVRYLIRGN